MSTDAPIPRILARPYETPMQQAVRQMREEEQRALAELAQYQWNGESAHGPMATRLMPNGMALVVVDTDRDGVYETQAAAIVGGRLVATPDMANTEANMIVTPGEAADEFAQDVREALRDQVLTGEEMDRLAERTLRAAGRLPASPAAGAAR